MFRKITVSDHSQMCRDENSQGIFSFNERHFCELNLERILFHVESDFYLMLVPRCIINDKYIFIEQLVRSCIQSSDIKAKYLTDIHKSITDKDLLELRLRGKELQKWVTQVHYSYENNSRKQYYIISDISFVENWLGTWNEDLKLSYDEAKKELKGDEYLLTQLEHIYDINKIKDYCSDVEIFKTIDAVAKGIRKTIKDKKNNN